MKTITSRQNPEIKAIAELANSKDRRKQGRFIAEGLRTCTALLESSLSLVQLYVKEEMAETIAHLVHEDDITIVNDKVLTKISLASSPSGILGVFEIPPQPTADKLTAGMVFARISDPGNMGTLIRTCAAMNIKSIVIVEGVDPWSSKVVQASAGTIGNVTLFHWNWAQLMAHKRTLKLCAMVVSGGKKPTELDLNGSLVVVGNEAEGIPTQWLQQCDSKMTLEMPGNAESLNAAVAGSIAIYLSKMRK